MVGFVFFIHSVHFLIKVLLGNENTYKSLLGAYSRIKDYGLKASITTNMGAYHPFAGVF